MRILAIVATLALAGCATLNPVCKPDIIEKPVPIEVKVPVVVPCITVDLQLPDLLTDQITDEDAADPGKVGQAYVADHIVMKSFILQQKKLMDACKVEGAPMTVIPAPVVRPFKPEAIPAPTPLPEVTPTPPAPPVAPTPPPAKPKTGRINPLEPSGKIFAPPPPQ